MITSSPLYVGRASGNGKSVGKSTSGPDWTDVATLMSALEILHGCRVGLTVITDGEGQNGQLSIALTATMDVLPSGQLQPIHQVLSTWPCKDCTSLAQHVFGGLYRLDFVIGEAYQQRFLPGVK